MIRAAETGDGGAVAALIVEVFADIEPPLDPMPSALRETPESVVRQIAAGGGAVWDEGGLQGCVLWRREGDALYVGRLAVRSGWRGRGIAARLLGAAEAFARAAGADRVTLAVRLALPGNRRLFAKAGFREIAIRAHDGFAAPTYAEAEKRL